MADFTKIIVDNTTYDVKDATARDLLYDTGWQNINIDTTKINNWSWEPFSYRKIGKIVYIHGGGSAAANLSNQEQIGTGLPLPKQNTSVIASQNNGTNQYNFLVSNDGHFQCIGGMSSGTEFLINMSYITRE